MADNKTIINGSGNVGTDYVVATDEIAGVNYERVKLAIGADGTAVDASTANPVPITGVVAEDSAAASGQNGLPILLVRQDVLSPSTDTNGDYGFLKSNANGELYVVASGALSVTGTMPVQQAPATSGGYIVKRTLSAASTNATSVKASAGQVFGWYLFNANAATRYLKLYNKASAPTVGTDTPVLTIPIPAGAAANVEYLGGIAFATGIAFALTTGIADADTGAVAANDVVVNLFYV